jgi:hypothetical protein
MNIRTLAAATVLLSTLSLPVFADACQDDVALLDKTLKSAEIDADIRAQADDMRNQAVQLCGAGNTEEGLAMTAEAKILLKIE